MPHIMTIRDPLRDTKEVMAIVLTLHRMAFPLCSVDTLLASPLRVRGTTNPHIMHRR